MKSSPKTGLFVFVMAFSRLFRPSPSCLQATILGDIDHPARQCPMPW